MDLKSPEFLYIGFVLPFLFSVTLVAEGLYKISKNEEGFFTFFLGVMFLATIIIGFVIIFLK